MGAFINLPGRSFKQVQRIKPQIHPETTHSHIVTIEDSPFLSRLKFKIITAIDRLPDPNGLYTNTFNSIIDRALLTHLKTEQEKIQPTGENVILLLPTQLFLCRCLTSA
ncbi:hypothetical protein ACLB1R_35570 [Escherichia coli]